MKPDRTEAVRRAAAQATATYAAAIGEAKRLGYWDKENHLSRKAERAARRLADLSRWLSRYPDYGVDLTTLEE
jgi:hypothetical protein